MSEKWETIETAEVESLCKVKNAGMENE